MKSPAKPIEPISGCVKTATDVIGQKWTALILRDLAAGPQRFCALEKSVGQINPRTLSQRLDSLEGQGIIERQACADAAPHCDYQLTAKGRDLVPVIEQMAAWGAKYHAG